MAASTGKKEYTLTINGLTKQVKDATKLSDVLGALDASIAKVNRSTVKSTEPTKAKAAAMTDEEKAAKKVEDIYKRIEKVRSAENKAVIEANNELKAETREVTRSITINKLAEGSIAQMGMQLTDLRLEYEALSATQRADMEVGGKMLEQIQALDSEYKALRESTGNFRDSVGNYEKGYKGLQDLTDKFELATRGSVGMATEVLGSNAALESMGTATNIVARSTEGMAGALALASTVSEAYNAIVKEGIIQQKTAAVIDGVRTVQLRAKTAAEVLGTKGTIGATIAQKALNAAANANPYLLLAGAILTVVGALAYFLLSGNKAVEMQKKANEIQAIHLDLLDREADKYKSVGEIQEKAAETRVSLLNASGAKTKEIRQAEDELNRQRVHNNDVQRVIYVNELANLDANRKKVSQLTEVMNKLRDAQARGKDKLTLDIDLNGKVEKVKVEDAINSVQGSIDNLGKQVSVAVGIKADQAQIQADIAIQRAQRLKADRDLAKERKDLEIDATRAAEDARVNLIQDSYARQRKVIQLDYARQIQDLRRNLEEQNRLQDTTLTIKARKAILAKITALEKQQTKDLLDLQHDRDDKILETERATEDSRLALMLDSESKARTEINVRYDRQIEDLKKRLAREKDLTEGQQAAITEMILNAQDSRGRELDALAATQAQKRADQEANGLEQQLTKSLNGLQSVTDGYTKRNKDGLKLIDVAGTRKNLASANVALGEYIDGLKRYQTDLSEAHNKTLETLKSGTPEYIDEMQKYAAATEDSAEKIKKAQADQVANSKASKTANVEYYKDLFSKISEYADAGVTAVSSVVDTLNMGLQAQLDGINSQIDEVSDKYDKAKALQESAAATVVDLENQIQSATGGTADALKEQLADSMHAREESAREEARLAKEKEKLQADAAKKEKQMKRLDMISQIAQGISNTAAGVTKALGLVFPLNLAVAGIVGAMGAFQVGIMTKQLTKLADGGLIKGPSHSNGGARIQGTNIEVEGGEYVVNKHSTRENKGLVSFINSTRRRITLPDVAEYFKAPMTSNPGMAGLKFADGGELPTIETTVNNGVDYEALSDAMSNVVFRPQVAVTDIINATNDLNDIVDLSGY